MIANKSYANARKNLFKRYPSLKTIAMRISKSLKVEIIALNNERFLLRDSSGLASEAYLTNEKKCFLVELNISLPELHALEKELSTKIRTLFDRQSILNFSHQDHTCLNIYWDGTL